MWYGEGDDMILIDGDEKPTLHGTGTEDYFNTSWCPKTLYSHPYYGYARVNDNCMTLDLASVAYWYPAPLWQSCRRSRTKRSGNPSLSSANPISTNGGTPGAKPTVEAINSGAMSGRRFLNLIPSICAGLSRNRYAR